MVRADLFKRQVQGGAWHGEAGKCGFYPNHPCGLYHTSNWRRGLLNDPSNMFGFRYIVLGVAHSVTKRAAAP
jgi:hypothetical protein